MHGQMGAERIRPSRIRIRRASAHALPRQTTTFPTDRSMAMSVLGINKLALDLVARDFSDGHTPNNGGPTKTSRALAIIHLAARDAYAKVTSAYPARLSGLPNPPAGLGTDDATGASAVLGAGIRAA